MAGLMLDQSTAQASRMAVRKSLPSGGSSIFARRSAVDVLEPVEAGRHARSGLGVEEREEVVEHLGKVGPVGGGVVADERGGTASVVPHVGVVAEHEEEDPGEGDGDLVVPFLGGSAVAG
jgi:hypothetical protein